jgi:SAM-dependent methyltransferase
VGQTSSRPARYELGGKRLFESELQNYMVPDLTVLDAGAGRAPVVPPSRRPEGWTYVGLDLSLSELQLAPAGSYDEMRAGDLVRRYPDLGGRFDLVLSWQVLEHVKPLGVALENLRSYLRPGGTLIAQFSGTFSAFGLINRVIPQRLGVWAMHRLLNRPPDSVFPAYYDKCWYSAISQMMSDWSDVRIEPRYLAAGYWSFSKPTEWAYLRYENWAEKTNPNLATHYLVVSRK